MVLSIGWIRIEWSFPEVSDGTVSADSSQIYVGSLTAVTAHSCILLSRLYLGCQANPLLKSWVTLQGH